MLLPEGKNLKIWGVSYGLVGDLIMGLPVLTYFEKKYPGSYKVWAIEKKVGQMGQFFLNHPLIDKIQITEEWSGFGIGDYDLASTCIKQCNMGAWQHSPVDWYNYRDCIEETARVAGVDDLLSVLGYEDLYPKLERWFNVGPEDPQYNTYSKYAPHQAVNDNIVSIFPFATGNGNIARSPSVRWWNELVYHINGMGFKVWQFGSQSDHKIDGTIYFNTKTFFEQVKIALSTYLTIGTDSGSMWVMGAYSQPAIHVITNWSQNHHTNFSALVPANRNGMIAFAEGGANAVHHDDVLSQFPEIMNDQK